MNSSQTITRSFAIAAVIAAGTLGLPARAADAAASFTAQVLAAAPAPAETRVATAADATAPARSGADGFVAQVLQPAACRSGVPATTQTAQGGERGPTDHFVHRVLGRVDG